MALRDFNYKQFFFDHGERIGVGAAGCLALLLLLPLFWPGYGFLAPSSGANAELLNKDAQKVESGLQHDQPGPEDKPGEPKLDAFKFDVIPGAKAKDYAVAGLYDGRSGGRAGRRMPDILAPKDADVALARLQLSALVYSKDYEYIYTLKGASAAGVAGGPPSPGGTGGPERGSPNMPNPPGGMSRPGSMYGSSLGRGSLQQSSYARNRFRGLVRDRNNPDADKTDKDYDLDPVEVKKLGSLSGAKVAEQAYPVRAAEIAAAFPYKAQIEEFRDKLGLPSNDAVLTETSLEPPAGDNKQPLAAFRFIGVDVQRRQLDGLGRPTDGMGHAVGEKEGWADLDLADAYAPLVVVCGGVDRLPPEDARLSPVTLPGLVMRKLPTFGDRRTPPADQYPKVEDNLASLKKTVDDLTKVPEASIAKPSFTQRPDNIFDLNPTAGPQGGPFGMPGPGNTGSPERGPPGPGGTTGPGKFGPGKPGSPPGPGGRIPPTPGGTGGLALEGVPPGLTQGQQGVIPDYCLIRLFDYTVEPGKTYEYRLRVRMANPNFDRKDAAAQGYAHEKDLAAKEWFVVPKRLAVPGDVYYYALDQSKMDAKEPPKEAKDKEKDKEPKMPVQLVHEGQTVLQLHKWVESLHTKNRSDLPIGDWVIAERVVATRGEPIGKQRVEVPYWRMTMDKFTMASDLPPPKAGDTRKVLATVDMAFAPEGEEPILVDFGGGDESYTRSHPRPENGQAPSAEPSISDKAAEEVLLLTSDGKLLAHNGAKDAADSERVKRLEEVRAWIQEVKKMKGGKQSDNLFGPTNPNN